MRWLYTAFFVLIGWVLFDLTDFPSLCHALKLMFVPQATDWVAAAATNVSLLKAVVYLPLGIVCCLPLLHPAGEPCLGPSADRVHRVHSQLVV